MFFIVISIWMNKQSCKILWLDFDPRSSAWLKKNLFVNAIYLHISPYIAYTFTPSSVAHYNTDIPQ